MWQKLLECSNTIQEHTAASEPRSVLIKIELCGRTLGASFLFSLSMCKSRWLWHVPTCRKRFGLLWCRDNRDKALCKEIFNTELTATIFFFRLCRPEVFRYCSKWFSSLSCEHSHHVSVYDGSYPLMLFDLTWYCIVYIIFWAQTLSQLITSCTRCVQPQKMLR